MNNYKVLYHNSIKINDIYIDPYNINNNTKAKYIFITHSHYDHLSIEDINKILTNETIIICPSDCYNKLKEAGITNEIMIVEPNKEYKIDDLPFKTTPAYNRNKAFHPINNNWVGYIINYQNTRFFIAGDTDYIDELKNISCDIAFVPIGGTYTMTAEEAANLINEIKPNIAIPTHYNAIVGSKEDEEIFKNLVNKDIKVEIDL